MDESIRRNEKIIKDNVFHKRGIDFNVFLEEMERIADEAAMKMSVSMDETNQNQSEKLDKKVK